MDLKILYYDCFSGLSGDMNLAAMIALGVDQEYLREELAKLDMQDEFSLRVGPGERKGICGTRVDVELHTHQPGQDQEHHHHHHHHDHDHQHHHDHHHRNLHDIETIIGQSGLEEAVRDTALRIFRRVAEAEAKVHGKRLDEVHFHEVGATDSIVDIVGAAICFHALDVDAVWCSPVELGGGFVQCAHGMMPVPAPATVEILHGVPTTCGAVDKECTTPTGAAIVAELADRFVSGPAMTVQQTGYGIGHRDNAIPNVLRVHLATVEQEQPSTTQVSATMLQCNIDDMTAEMLGVVLDQLMEEGAMDVHFTPIIMKKSRSATMVSVLCREEETEQFQRLLFQHTTTLGIKSVPVHKTELERRIETMETPLGPVRVKRALLDGRVLRSKPELEDCRALAKQHGLSLLDIYAGIRGTE